MFGENPARRFNIFRGYWADNVAPPGYIYQITRGKHPLKLLFSQQRRHPSVRHIVSHTNSSSSGNFSSSNNIVYLSPNLPKYLKWLMWFCFTPTTLFPPALYEYHGIISLHNSASNTICCLCLALCCHTQEILWQKVSPELRSSLCGVGGDELWLAPESVCPDSIIQLKRWWIVSRPHPPTLSLVNTTLSSALIGRQYSCNYVILYPNLVVVQFACIGWHLVPQLSPLIFDALYQSIYWAGWGWPQYYLKWNGKYLASVLFEREIVKKDRDKMFTGTLHRMLNCILFVWC